MKTAIFKYKNYEGKISTRSIIPECIEFIERPGFGYQGGWFLSGFDNDKQARRSFFLANIIFPEGVRSFRINLE